MTSPRTEHEWIIDYLNHRLSDCDLEIFERRLIDEPALLDDTWAVVALRVGLRELQRDERSARLPTASGVTPTSIAQHDVRDFRRRRADVLHD